MKSQIEYEYFEWIVGLSENLCSEYGSYRNLFEYLYSREFYSNVGNDCNRAEDGLDMRMRFAEQSIYTYPDVYNYLKKPCNMLEMMVALAFRCEDHIMWDPDEGDRTGLWLATMITSLGLSDLIDNNWNEEHAKHSIDIFLAHQYKRNGEGGLFNLKNKKEDLRKVEIWYQMCWYLDEYINKRV